METQHWARFLKLIVRYGMCNCSFHKTVLWFLLTCSCASTFFLHVSIYVLQWRPKCKPIPTASRALHRSHNDLVLNPSQPLRTSSRLNNILWGFVLFVCGDRITTPHVRVGTKLDRVILVEGSQTAQQAHKWCWINAFIPMAPIQHSAFFTWWLSVVLIFKKESGIRGSLKLPF